MPRRIACTLAARGARFEIEVALPEQHGHTLADLLAGWGIDDSGHLAVGGIRYRSDTDITEVAWFRGAVVDSTPPPSQPVGGRPVANREIDADGTVPWRRPPRMEFPVAPPPVPLPQARPAPTATRRFGVVTLIVPATLGIALALFWNPMFALFALLSPVMALANWADDRRRHRRQRRENAIATESDLARLEERLAATLALDEAVRRRAHPAISEVIGRVASHDPRIWERRPDQDDFLRTAVGTACQTWEPSTTRQGPVLPAAYDALEAFDTIHSVPLPLALGEGAVVGIVGDARSTRAAARALLLQVATHQGPADCAITLVTEHPDVWDWIKWLPHLICDATTHALAVATCGDQVPPAPEGRSEVLVVDVDDLADRRWAGLRERVAHVSGAVLSIGRSVDRLPSQSGVIIDVDRRALSAPATGVVVQDVDVWLATTGEARRTARSLAKYHDPDAREMGADLPHSVRLTELLGLEDPTPDAVALRWSAQPAVPCLAAPIGKRAGGVFEVDPVADGPHGLLAGTTGSGKSELLRTVVVSMAATVDSEHLNFVLIDYKGGSAFDSCARLPHTVGMVTDLDGHLAARALACLEAELRHREQRLRDCGAENLDEFHAKPIGDPLPRLLVVIDEFAALAKELPDFVDALVDVAQRGRSLGVHLLLATQRPHGVINDAIRANTNLRISLRVQDKADSIDVIGRPDAAAIDRTLPGRGLARFGQDDVVPFQAALVSVGGDAAASAFVTRPFRLVGSPTGPDHAHGDDGRPTDLERLVDAIAAATMKLGHGRPRAPWPDPLPECLHPADVAAVAADDSEPLAGVSAIIGLSDEPHRQRRAPMRWGVGDGHMLMYGVPGSGTSTALAAVVLGLARTHEPSQVHIYVIDCDDQSLVPLDGLGHVGAVIRSAESERQLRLLRMMNAEIVKRRLSTATGGAALPEIVLGIDNYAGLLANHDGPHETDVRAMLSRIFTDGPGVGITVVATAKQPGDVPHRIAALAPCKLAFRLTDRFEYKGLGIESPPVITNPGRAVSALTQLELQVALPHADGIGAAVAEIGPINAVPPPPPVGVLAEEVKVPDILEPARLFDLEWVIPVGIGDSDLKPVSLVLRPGDHALVAGPARSGKSTTLAAVAAVVRQTRADVAIITIASRRSPLAVSTDVDIRCDTVADAVAALEPGAPTLLLVDDAELVDDDDGTLAQLIATGDESLHVIAAGAPDVLRGMYAHWTRGVRRSRIGVLLMPGEQSEGDLLQVSLPRIAPDRWCAGRGYLAQAGVVELTQIAGVP